MARDRIETRFGFPPQPSQPASLPAAIPWKTPIHQLTGLWISRQCSCGSSSLYPLRRMAADLGWQRTLADLVPAFRCRECGSREFLRLELVDDPTAGVDGAIGNVTRRALDLRSGAGLA